MSKQFFTKFKSKSEININGKKYQASPGDVISMTNNTVFINGVVAEDIKLDDCKVVNVTIKGDCDIVECNGSATITGDVHGDVNTGTYAEIGGSCRHINAGTYVKVGGDSSGDIDAGTSISISGSHTGGSIDAGTSVNIGK